MKRGNIVAIALILMLGLCGCNSGDYKAATMAYENGDYALAYELFGNLGDYKDSAQMMIACQYGQADEMLKNGQYQSAYNTFLSMGDYKDSESKAKEAAYRQADELLLAGQYSEAIDVLSEAGAAQERILNAKYLWADDTMNNGEYEIAEELFLNLATYKDAQEKAEMCHNKAVLDEAEELFYSEEYDDALTIFQSFEESSDLYDQICEAVYAHGMELYDEKEYRFCESYMKFVGNYENSLIYSYLAGFMNKYEHDVEFDYYAVANVLKGYADEGFMPAEEALEQEPFENYMELIEKQGLYRSDETFTRATPISKYQLYCYISIGSSIMSTAYTLDAEKTSGAITEDKVRTKAQDADYDCDCVYIGDGLYHCDVSWDDNIRGDTWTYSFNLSFRGDTLVISSLDNSEPDNVISVTAGTYSRFQ